MSQDFLSQGSVENHSQQFDNQAGKRNNSAAASAWGHPAVPAKNTAPAPVIDLRVNSNPTVERLKKHALENAKVATPPGFVALRNGEQQNLGSAVDRLNFSEKKFNLNCS